MILISYHQFCFRFTRKDFCFSIRIRYPGVEEIWGSDLSSVCVLQQHNTELVVGMVRQQFKKHMNETDPEKIQKLKDE